MIRASNPVWVLAATVMTLCGTAHAGNQDLYGFGARGPGLSGAAVAFPRGFEAIYYNPAGLVLGGARTFSIGFQATSFDLNVASPRPDDVASATDEPLISGITLGIDVRLPLEGILKDRIAIGLGLYIPTDTLLSAEIASPGGPQFSLVADRARAVVVQAGLAVKIGPWLSLGGGIRALAGLRGFIDVGPNDLGRIGSTVEDELIAEYGGVVGFVARPHPTIAVAAAWRGALGGPYSLPINAQLGDSGIPIQVPPINLAGTAVWDPQQVAMHIGYQPLDELTIEVGVTWKQWSATPIPIENTTAAIPPQEPLEFEDTWVARLGIESELLFAEHWRFAARGGYAFEPSPVPDQTGQHNFLDGDRHIVSIGLGTGYGLGDESAFRVDLDFYAQVHVMAPRTFVKEVPAGKPVILSDNAGFPWIGAAGTIVSFGTVLEVQL